MELNEVRDYLKNLCIEHNIQVLGKDKYKALYDRDNYVILFSVKGVFSIQLSILQVRTGDYEHPCIRFSIYSHRRPENGAIGRDAIWLGAIGFWLRKRFADYLTLRQINLDGCGDIVYPDFGGDVEGHVLGIVVSGTKNWQTLDNFDDSVQTNIQNIYNILQGFFNTINGITNLDEEIRQYNNDHSGDYNNYIHPNNTQNRPNQPVGTEAQNQGEADTQVTNIDKPRNLIYFGAPGTGKSYKLNESLKDFKKNFERVTFYPTYSYAQFVGTYKPVMKADGESNEEISYEFVPGPFLRVLVQALKNQEANYCLVIEEINRANAAAVFGDVFQLLDRDTNGVSEYKIATSEDVKKYLFKILGKESFNLLFSKNPEQIKITQENLETISISLYIPQNMYIWATMNSADQGVFPMDTAFKRRWSFEYIGIDDGVTDECECKGWVIEGPNINWNVFRKFVNGLLSSFDVNEDKLMGPYFVKADKKEDNIDQISKKLFASKVLMYLWEDAARMIRKNIFGAEIKTYSQLVSEWKDKNIRIFDYCKSKLENNKELSDLYKIMNPPGDTKSTTQAEDAITANNGNVVNGISG